MRSRLNFTSSEPKIQSMPTFLGTWPLGRTLVMEKACWFQMGRDEAQRSSRSLTTRMPPLTVVIRGSGLGWVARQTLPPIPPSGG